MYFRLIQGMLRGIQAYSSGVNLRARCSLSERCVVVCSALFWAFEGIFTFVVVFDRISRHFTRLYGISGFFKVAQPSGLELWCFVAVCSTVCGGLYIFISRFSSIFKGF